MKNQWALITGASSGIGTEIATEYAKRGVNLVLSARREERLNELATRLKEQFNIRTHVITQDLSEPNAAKNIFQNTQANNIDIAILVNNAGYGLGQDFLDTDWKTISDFLKVMVNAVTELTHHYLPSMIEKKYGRVLFISSMVTFIPTSERFGLYRVVKMFMNNFSETIRYSTSKHGIHVTTACPGLTHTEFQKVAGYENEMKKMIPGFLWMSANAVAQAAIKACEKNQSLVITGLKNKLLYWLLKITPAFITRKFI